MRALYFIASLLIISSVAKAQDEKGIRFEKGLNWVGILEKAKKENKYIFLDAFTTWCGPCKMMAKEIFPQAKVGELFNQSFINVAVQFDSTKKDNQEIKSWYKDASVLAKTYNITSFPTYLFFDPQGKLVHGIYSAVPDADEFIRLVNEAIDPKKQFLNLKQQYVEGNRDPEFLYTLVVAAIRNRDNELTHASAASYLETRPDLLTDRNIKLLPVITKKTSDPGFAALRNYAVRADLILGNGYSGQTVKTIIFDEIILPVLRIGGVKIDHGMMQFYQGELSKNVNWEQLRAHLDLKYPEYSEELMLSSKLTYLDWSKNWDLLNKTIAGSLAVNKNAISSVQLTRLANKFFLVVDDMKMLEETLEWAKLNLTNLEDQDEKLDFIVTYAQLLDKAGHKKEAVKQLKAAVELTDGKAHYAIEILEQMKKENQNK